MKYKLLFLLTMQRMIYNTIIHHSSIINFPCNYLLLLSDLIRCTVCFVMYITFKPDKKLSHDVNIIIFPALLYYINQTSEFYGMTWLDPSMHQMLYQINIIFAALVSPKRLNIQQKISIACLFIGICTVLFNRDDVIVLPHHSHIYGIFCTIIAAASAAIGSQAFEDVLKSEHNTTWKRQLQLSFFSLIGAIFSCYIENIHYNNIYHLSNELAVLVIIKTLGDIIIPFVLKYLDNITKGVSDTMATMLSLPLSQLMYNWHPHIGFYIGSTLVSTSAMFYVFSKNNQHKTLHV